MEIINLKQIIQFSIHSFILIKIKISKLPSLFKCAFGFHQYQKITESYVTERIGSLTIGGVTTHGKKCSCCGRLVDINEKPFKKYYLEEDIEDGLKSKRYILEN